jgi:hypothetical protein
VTARSRPSRRSPAGLLTVAVVVVLVALAVTGFASRFASSAPDGLERVAEDHGFDDRASDHALADSPVADYSLRGIDDDVVATGAAGAIGVLATLGVGAAVAVVLQRGRTGAERSPRRPAPSDP